VKLYIELTDAQLAELVDAVAAKVAGPSPRKPYTVQQYADATGAHRDTIYRNIEAGIIRTVPGMGRKKLIPASEIDRLIGGQP